MDINQSKTITGTLCSMLHHVISKHAAAGWSGHANTLFDWTWRTYGCSLACGCTEGLQQPQHKKFEQIDQKIGNQKINAQAEHGPTT